MYYNAFEKGDEEFYHIWFNYIYTYVYFSQGSGKMDLNMAKELKKLEKENMKENGKMTW